MKSKSTPRRKHGQVAAGGKNHFPKPAIPAEYPWVVLGHLTGDLAHLILDEGFLGSLENVVRKRDVHGLLTLASETIPQCIGTVIGRSTQEIRAVYQLCALLKKFPFSTSKEQRTESAKAKFAKAETKCHEFNSKLYRDVVAPGEDDTAIALYTYATAFIRKVLGDFPSFPAVSEWSRHGPGVTLSTLNGANSAYYKFAEWPYDCTEEALPHAKSLIEQDERWLGALEDSYRDVMEIPRHRILDRRVFWANVFHVVPGNRVTFVPKDALTERTIAIEPVMNLALQLGVDGFIRRRLKRFGVNLDSQEKNQELARLGSMYGGKNYCTIDLEAASDTVSLKLCEVMLPPAWYQYLVDLRSPIGQLGDDTYVYSKVSSMGNGYTFALESLLFAAIIYAAHKHTYGRLMKEDFAVFGDDLIVTSDIADLVIGYLTRCGFATNAEKTFLEGPFRESCGTDWFLGHNIRPLQLKTVPNHAKSLFSDRNRVRRMLRIGFGLTDSATVSRMDSWIPIKLKSFIGPNSNEDFDSYLHQDRPGGIPYRDSLYKIKRLIFRPKSFKGNKFFFRKLMNPLRGRPLSRDEWVRDTALTNAGGSFVVTKFNRVITSVSHSRVSIWPDTYDT